MVPLVINWGRCWPVIIILALGSIFLLIHSYDCAVNILINSLIFYLYFEFLILWYAEPMIYNKYNMIINYDK